MSRKFPSDKANDTKKMQFYNFTFNLRFLYELKHKIRLSKTVCEIFHFRFRSFQNFLSALLPDLKKIEN